jgi:hypothetical protein
VTCQYNEYDKPRGCRRRARVTVTYKRLFGMKVTGKGDEAVYMTAVSHRCEEHATPAYFVCSFISAERSESSKGSRTPKESGNTGSTPVSESNQRPIGPL